MESKLTDLRFKSRRLDISRHRNNGTDYSDFSLVGRCYDAALTLGAEEVPRIPNMGRRRSTALPGEGFWDGRDIY